MAGSSKGERRGGRKKGTPNKKTAGLIAKVEEGGITPLDFLLAVMRGELPERTANDPPELASERFGMRFEAAKAAAPYVHAKRTQIEGTGEGGAVVLHITGMDANL